MKVFRQDPWPDDREPYVFAEGVVNLKYPVGLFAVDTESFSPTLQLIQVGEFEGKLLVAVPEIFSSYDLEAHFALVCFGKAHFA